MARDLNRRERRHKGVPKNSMNNVEFREFLDKEAETQRRIFVRSRMNVAVRFALYRPHERMVSANIPVVKP